MNFQKTGKIVGGYDHRRGFTILEILLALAVVAMATGFVVMRSDSIFAGIGERPLEELVQRSVREARYQAAQNKAAVFLRWNEDEASLQVLGETGNVLQTFRSGYDPSRDNVRVTFLRVVPERGTNLRVRNPNYRETSQVVFHPDRTSEPFAVRLRIDHTESTHRFDPFSDAELRVGGGA